MQQATEHTDPMSQILERLGMLQYRTNFMLRGVRLSEFVTMTDQQLRDVVGVEDAGHRATLLNEISNL